jgi:hypothetical protein
VLIPFPFFLSWFNACLPFVPTEIKKIVAHVRAQRGFVPAGVEFFFLSFSPVGCSFFVLVNQKQTARGKGD